MTCSSLKIVKSSQSYDDVDIFKCVKSNTARYSLLAKIVVGDVIERAILTLYTKTTTIELFEYKRRKIQGSSIPLKMMNVSCEL